MELTIKDIMVFEPVAMKLLNYEWETPKISYNVFKLSNFILEEKRFFFMERSKLFKKYGKADGDNVKITEDNASIFQDEISSLLSMKVAVPEIEFTMDDVFRVEYIKSNELEEASEKLTPLDMCRIEAFLNAVNKHNDESNDSQTQIIGQFEAE